MTKEQSKQVDRVMTAHCENLGDYLAQDERVIQKDNGEILFKSVEDFLGIVVDIQLRSIGAISEFMGA